MDAQTDATTSLLTAAGWKQRLVFWSGAILVGLSVSALTVLSEQAVVHLRAFFDRTPTSIWLISPLGLMLTVWLTERWFPGAERSGVPQVKAALAIHGDLTLRQRFVSFPIAVGKVALTNLGLLAGASAGLGGPAIQIGASIMTTLGKAARFPPHYLERGFILAGSAAGFAALFSAPLAGIIFAIEELGREMEEKISSLVLTAIIFAGMTAYVILNHYIFLEATEVAQPQGRAWLSIGYCGIAGGLAGGIFAFLLVRLGQRLSQESRRSRWALIALFGLLLAALATLSEGQTLGTGYPMLKQIVNANQAASLWFPLEKALATLITALSGTPAGLFVPSLSVGAGLGADLHHWLPLAPLQTMVLLTMCAYFSGMLQNPMTAFVLVMEMTDTHELLLPLMATAFIATGTARLFNPRPLCEILTGNYVRNLPQQA